MKLKPFEPLSSQPSPNIQFSFTSRKKKKTNDTDEWNVYVHLKKKQQNFDFTGHPRFFNQLSCGLDLISMAGEWLTATANTNMFTYEIAPVFILMENVVMTHMREIIGGTIWRNGDSILAPGKYVYITIVRDTLKQKELIVQ